MNWMSASFGLACALACAAPVAATDAVQELGFSYAARATSPTIDDDIVSFSYGVTVPGAVATYYFGGALGGRSGDFDDFGVYGKIEGAAIWSTGTGRYGFGARVRAAEDFPTTYEVFGGAERWFDRSTLRGLAGIEGADDPVLGGGDDFGGFAYGEFSFYPNDRLALRAGLLVQQEDALAMVGIEGQPFRQSPVSFFVDYVPAIGEYRGRDGVDDLVFGVRFELNGDTLKRRDRSGGVRFLSRPRAVD